MKIRMIVSALLILLLTVGISFNSDASPWRHGYGRGWGHPVVRVGVPAIGIGVAPVVVGGGGYYGGYYPAPAYYGGYYATGPRYYGGGYGHGYYGRGGGYHGGYRGGYHGRR